MTGDKTKKTSDEPVPGKRKREAYDSDTASEMSEEEIPTVDVSGPEVPAKPRYAAYYSDGRLHAALNDRRPYYVNGIPCFVVQPRPVFMVRQAGVQPAIVSPTTFPAIYDKLMRKYSYRLRYKLRRVKRYQARRRTYRRRGTRALGWRRPYRRNTYRRRTFGYPRRRWFPRRRTYGLGWRKRY